MADPLGSDWDSYKLNDDDELDLDPYGGTVEGPRAVAQCVARGFETPAGSMWWAEGEGFSLADHLNADLDASDILAIATGMEADALRDERVAGVGVAPDFDAAAGKLSISVNGTTAEGPFALVLESDALAVSVLQVNA